MSRTFRRSRDDDARRPSVRPATAAATFRCAHCKRIVGPLPSGGHHRNHCPSCLTSRHVDDRRSGDRASSCGARMLAIGVFERPSGEQVIVHQCLGCGFERYNRVAADDSIEAIMALPVVPPRWTSRHVGDPQEDASAAS